MASLGVMWDEFIGVGKLGGKPTELLIPTRYPNRSYMPSGNGTKMEVTSDGAQISLHLAYTQQARISNAAIVISRQIACSHFN